MLKNKLEKVMGYGMLIIITCTTLMINVNAGSITVSDKNGKSDKKEFKHIVVIDAGHGGYDPGKIGITGKFEKGYKVGIISSAESKDRYRYGEVISIGSRNNEISISKNLYKVLREFDDKQVDYILGETFRSEELGQAIMNRLLKAAGYQVETVI
mgnify:CR=1 FL=1